MNKQELRDKYIKIRKNIDNKRNKDDKIFNTIINTEEYKKSKLVLTYVSLQNEVDTIKLIKYSLKIGKKVAVPKCKKVNIIFNYIDKLEELKSGNFNILEPINGKKVETFSKSICFVPGITFDKYNNRIGYGRGFYDRFLRYYEGTKIGLAYRECICERIEIDKYDVKMDKIIFDAK